MEFQWCIGTVQVYRFSAGDGILIVAFDMRAAKARKIQVMNCMTHSIAQIITLDEGLMENW